MIDVFTHTRVRLLDACSICFARGLTETDKANEQQGSRDPAMTSKGYEEMLLRKV